MSRERERAAPKSLNDITHLFFSGSRASGGPGARAAGPAFVPQAGGGEGTVDPASVLAWLAAHGAALVPGGGRFAAADFKDPGAPAAIFADSAGNPVLVEILDGDTSAVPFLILRGREWLASRAGLFVRAFGAEGIRAAADPLFILIAPHFSTEVVSAVRSLGAVRVVLYEARAVRLEGTEGALLRPVFSTRGDKHPAAFIPR